MTNGEKIQTILDVDRDCTEVHGKNGIMTFSVSQDWWNAEYKEPSSSGKPNKSIEEKCPCYYCEHFEIKGLSHCKIHEDAYGDSRCNDYHKINQKPNKSEIPTGSTTKNDLGIDCISREQAIRELKESAEHHANDSREEALLHRDRDIIRALPPVPIRPKGHWIEYSWNDNGIARWGLECDKCHKKYKYGGVMWDNPSFCPNCGSDNREVKE